MMSDDLLIPRRKRGAHALRAGAVVVAALAFVTPAVIADPVAAAGARTVRVSVTSSQRQARGISLNPRISANGRYVAFVSNAPNLAPGGAKDAFNAFVRDRQAGTTRQVNLSGSGAPGDDGITGDIRISADGRYVAFSSSAGNLVHGDTNGTSDVFVRDLQRQRTTRVSLSGTGAQGNDFSSGSLGLSADGRYVAFESYATNLVPGDTNGFADLFLHDRRTGRTSRVNLGDDGSQANHVSGSPSVSADGRYVAFTSYAGNLVAGDTNNQFDVFVRDRRTGRTTLISRTPAGRPGQFNSYASSISADGRYVAFTSDSLDLVGGDLNEYNHVFVRDLRIGRTTLVSVSSSGRQANDFCNRVTMSADGRYVLFSSRANTLVPGDTNAVEDVFLRDRWRRTTTRISLTDSGGQSNGYSSGPSIGAGGHIVTFESNAGNLVPGDTNAEPDVFVRVR
ncbi:TolB family protein [Actinoplanes sp. NPDC049265]|uniref:TolB family protein n=1 Tax=Actinoplanes sp. NPDC049265 TaxID=3363902 RepID=UPI003724850B